MPNYADLDNNLSGGAIQLPFAAPLMVWYRGVRQVPADVGAGVTHHGGWAVKAEEIAENAFDASHLNNEWFTPDSGKSYEVYATRALHVAPIGKRVRWEVTEYGSKRSHVQLLAMSAVLNSEAKRFDAWHAVTLTAKGLAAKSLEDALSAWKAKSAPLRLLLEKGSAQESPWCYWITLGTFGEAKYLPAGKGNNASYYTPVELYMPDDKQLTPEWLSRRFVGIEVADAMLEMADMAKDWMRAWDNYEAQPQPAQPMPPEPDYPAQASTPPAPGKPMTNSQKLAAQQASAGNKNNLPF